MTTTATVELLTAEVRVLMVGSRQVTLSVYRQLDQVMPGRIQPFGRVHDNRSSDRDTIEVVGANDVHALCRSHIYFDDYDFQFASPEYRYRLEVARNKNMAARLKTIYETWRELPLIVLAGLR
jgi:hypothetical protein